MFDAICFKPGCISCMPDGFVPFSRNLPLLEWNSAAVLLLKMSSQTSICGVPDGQLKTFKGSISPS